MQSRVHVSLEVSNLEGAVAFYSRLFQTEPTKVRSDYANFRLEEPGLHLALVAAPSRTPEPKSGPGSNRHFGIELFSDDRLATWLKAGTDAGLALKVEQDITCCYARANKFWAQDPDGHNWEFWVRHAEADSMHDDASDPQSGEASCCAPAAEAKAETPSGCAPKAGCCG